MRTRANFGLIEVEHINMKVAVGDGSGYDSGVDVVSLPQTVFHMLSIQRGWVDEYIAECERKMSNPAVLPKRIAAKILTPCRRCWK
jgi:hypothetical protein